MGNHPQEGEYIIRGKVQMSSNHQKQASDEIEGHNLEFTQRFTDKDEDYNIEYTGILNWE